MKQLGFRFAAFATAIALVATPLGLAQDGSAQLASLLDDMWEFRLDEDPLFATSVGDHRANDRLPQVSVADSARRDEQNRAFQRRLESIDRAALAPRDQVNYDIVARELREDIAEFDFQSHLIPITNRSGFHIEFPELRRDVPLDS